MASNKCTIVQIDEEKLASDIERLMRLGDGKTRVTIAERNVGNVSGIEAEVCKDIARRQALGLNKYGVSVADSPLALRDWLEHAYLETLDKAVYLKRAIAELEKAE